MKLKHLLFVIVCIATIHLRAVAAVDAFLEIDGIQGESHDRMHANAIDIFAFSWGMSNAIQPAGGAGISAGKAQFQDLSVTKTIDKTTTSLMQACATGQHIKKAVLYLRKAGARPVDYLKITLEDVQISSVSLAGNTDDDRPTETLSLNFAKAKVEHTQPGAKGGDPSVTTFEWNPGQNQEN